MTGVSERSQRTNIALAVSSVVIALFATVLILYSTSAAGSQSPIAGDPQAYDAIAAALFDGGIPYVDVPVEHFPGALAPMLVIEGLANVSGVNFTLLWAIAMSTAFVASVVIVGGIPTTFNAGQRYLVLALPLLPLVLFRVEPWLMMWVVASIAFAFQSSWEKSSLTAFIAALTKGWPVILLALPFRSGRRKVALWAGLGTILVLIGVSLLPGFREGRAFEGIHTETFVGTLLLVIRELAGVSPQLVGAAGAAYVAVGTWAVGLNLVIGLPFIFTGLRGVSTSSEIEEQLRAIGLVVLGIILASPLFSAQFVFWLVPFVLFLRSGNRILFFALSMITLVSIIWWAPTELAWSVLVFGRNGLLIALAVNWTYSLLKGTRVTPGLEHVA